MPSVSKKQQRVMGMAHAMQKGEMSESESPMAAEIAESMKTGDVKAFASTSTKGLPEKKGPRRMGTKASLRKPGNVRKAYKTEGLRRTG